MNSHNSDDLTERFSMGRLEGGELVAFEEHLLLCEQCQAGASAMDLLVRGVRSAAEYLEVSAKPTPELLPPAKFKGAYFVLQTVLPNSKLKNIGVLLHDARVDRLYCRFRRDIGEFPGNNIDRLQQLPRVISEMAHELGAAKCLAWLESTSSIIVGMSEQRSILIDDCFRTLERLYAKHIHPNVLRFWTHLPRYSLEAAAGKFGRQMVVEPEGWVEVRSAIPLTDDMFVTHVKGHSMEPTIPDASLCAFRSKMEGAWDGKILLLEHYGESGGSRYTVKLCRLSKDVDPTPPGDDAWLHQRVTLESINPEYKSWDSASADKVRPLGEFLFVV
jgi:Peptidase S24-like